MARTVSGSTPNMALDVMQASSAQPLRILLLGANGQLGSHLAQTLTALGTVQALGRAELDLADASRCESMLLGHLDRFQPNVVVNAAAYTAVDKAESEPEVAMQVNGHAVRMLAQHVHARDGMLLHYSTDYVFDGSGDRAWTEEDTPHPLSVYGRSKWLGEQAIAQSGARACVLRTSWVVGAQGSNFLKTMLRLATQRNELRVVADQVGAPTSVALLARVSLEMIRCMHNQPADDPRWGVYHVAPRGETSWHGYALHAIARAQNQGLPLSVQLQDIHAIRTEDYPLPAPRPRNSRLSTAKLCRSFALDLPTWQDGIDAVIDDILGATPS